LEKAKHYIEYMIKNYKELYETKWLPEDCYGIPYGLR
jgi:hypothetical protein